MGTDIYRVLIFLKRRPGLSLEEFRDYYETYHAKMALKYAAGLVRYTRRYIDPVPNDETGASGELDFDVITELWFDDKIIAGKVLKMAQKMTIPPDIRADEEKLFDRSKTRYASAIATESDLSGISAG